MLSSSCIVVVSASKYHTKRAFELSVQIKSLGIACQQSLTKTTFHYSTIYLTVASHMYNESPVGRKRSIGAYLTLGGRQQLFRILLNLANNGTKVS